MVSACPNEATLFDLLEGLLSAEEEAAVHEHLDGCARCRAALAEAADPGADPTEHGRPPGSVPPTQPVAPGSRLGRYVVLHPVGRGGMGAVFAAYDPQLDRRVALKLLNLSGDASLLEEARARLVREGQALAKLSHPHVVAVHDVGTYEGGVFIAMDFVDGTSLRQWLSAEPRPWRKVVEVFLAAGRGLAAAHAAGVVHRDFKPDNVLVGRDGWVRVTDFGLARVASRPEEGMPSPELASTADGLVDSQEQTTLTREGVVMGTPAYMAPEQVRGQRVDARSDQFSFCLALYEALYGVRPYPGKTPKERAAAATGVLNPPAPGISLPPRVRRPLRRGLKANPDERYPSMEPLIDDLAHAARSFRRRWALAGTAIGLVVLGALGAGYVGAQRVQLCSGAAARTASVWNVERRSRIHDAFLATRMPYAESAWAAAERSLDEYVRAWERTQTESCEATRIRGEQTEAQLGLRTACLERRLQELEALAALFGQADAEVVGRAPDAARALEDLSSCADLTGLAARSRSKVNAAAQEQVDAAVARSKALLESGKYAEAVKALEPVLTAPEPRPELARAFYLRGRAQHALSRYPDAEASFHLAAAAAEEGGDDEVKALAWVHLVDTVGASQGRFAEAQRWVQHASASVTRLGPSATPDLRAELHFRLGLLHLAESAPDLAIAELERARQLVEAQRGPEDPRLIRLLVAHGTALNRKASFDAAMDVDRRVLALTERTLGSAHPDLATAHNNMASVLYALRRWPEAREHFQRALEIYQAAFGPDSRRVGQARHNLGNLLRAEGHPQEALAEVRAAREILEKSLGPSHAHVARALVNEGLCLLDLRRANDALALARRAQAIWQAQKADNPDAQAALRLEGEALESLGQRSAASRAYAAAVALVEKSGEAPPALASLLWHLARLDLAMGQPQEALRRSERALAIDERAFGGEHPDVGQLLLVQGRARLALGDARGALPVLQRAAPILAKAVDAADEREELRRALAQAEAAAARGSRRR